MSKASATVIKLQKLLPTCPACLQATSSHSFGVIATTVIGDREKPRVTEFLGHVKRHEWNSLSRFKDWQSERDHLVAYVITCRKGGGVVFVVRNPFELYDADEALLEEALTPEDLAAVSGLVPEGEWQTL